tara:strand:- start:262 stop:477 length:216 start_codon:yes stop_codon:yes gene_type:complete
MRNQDIIQAAKDHGMPISWVHEALVNYDVRERGVSFACYYGAAMQNAKTYNHVLFMQEAARYLNHWRGIES